MHLLGVSMIWNQKFHAEWKYKWRCKLHWIPIDYRESSAPLLKKGEVTSYGVIWKVMKNHQGNLMAFNINSALSDMGQVFFKTIQVMTHQVVSATHELTSLKYKIRTNGLHRFKKNKIKNQCRIKLRPVLILWCRAVS